MPDIRWGAFAVVLGTATLSAGEPHAPACCGDYGRQFFVSADPNCPCGSPTGTWTHGEQPLHCRYGECEVFGGMAALPRYEYAPYVYGRKGEKPTVGFITAPPVGMPIPNTLPPSHGSGGYIAPGYGNTFTHYEDDHDDH